MVRAALSRALRLDRLAIGAVGATLALMTLGSVVHGTGSSLACPDWPLCHGSALPAMTGGVQFEHSHRLAAAAVVVLTIALAVAAWRQSDRLERRLALAACGLIALQAVLGAATVLMGLPPAVSVAHLATSMAFLAVLVVLAGRLGGFPRSRADAATRTWLTIAAMVVYLQILLGGVVRHMGAALACPDLPSCAGSMWPVALLQRLHMVHRAGALVALIVVVAATLVLYRKAQPVGARHALVLAPAVLVLCQGALGIAVVSTGAPLAIVTAHHATGALLLASLVLAWTTCRSESQGA